MAESMILDAEIAEDEAGLEALGMLADRFPDVLSAELRRAMRDGSVTLNGGLCTPGQHLAVGDRLVVSDALARIDTAPLAGFSVAWDSPTLLACIKPAGVAVEADRGDGGLRFKSAILHFLKRAKRHARPRVVHRIDKGTSGLVLVALSRTAMAHMTREFEERRVEKEYLALITGCPKDESGVVDRPLVVHKGRRRGRAPVEVGEDGKPARTRWEVEERLGRYALLRVHPETGRHHQIRAHMAAEGHPLAVDFLYGGAKQILLSELKRGYRKSADGETPLLDRLSLHAHRLAFTGPAGDRVEVEAPLPKDLRVTLKQLARWS